MSTIAPTTSNNATTTSTNGLLNPKTNRTLFKNIKNTNVSNTPNTNLKKNSINNIIGNGPSSNVNKKVNNAATGGVVSDKNNILFTPSKNSMVSRNLATNVSSSSTNNESFLDIAAIEKDLKRMEAFTGGISPMSSPVKNTIPIAIVDLESFTSSTDDSSKIVATTKKPSVVYSVDLLLSFKTANTKRPVQIDIVENHQKEIVVPVSLPSTPYVNNHNNNISSNSHNNSQQKYPIFSPQISPFKIAYNSQQSSSSNANTSSTNNKNTNIVTPTKKQQNGSSTVTTPQNSYYSNNSNSSNSKSSTKKQQNNQNPIPFSLNTTNTTPKSNKKLTANTTTTPKSNKKITTTDVTAAFIAATNVTGSHEDEVEASANNTNNADDSSIVLPSPSKKVAQKETDQKRLAARQRQIDIGKMTAGYKNYIAQVPKSKRKPTDPKTPNKNQVCSKRSWDGQIRIWRRLLHSYDSQGTEFNDEELDREMNALEIACSLISIQSTPTKN